MVLYRLEMAESQKIDHTSKKRAYGENRENTYKSFSK